MSFEWVPVKDELTGATKLFLRHTDLNGNVQDVPFNDTADYLSNLHASEKQSPVPTPPAIAPASDQKIPVSEPDPGSADNVDEQSNVQLALPTPDQAAQLATSPDIQAAANSNPAPIIAAIDEAVARSTAALNACTQAHDDIVALATRVKQSLGVNQ